VNNAESIKSAIPEKPIHHDTPKMLSKFSSYHWSNIRLVTAIGLCVFLCEAFVMKAIVPLFDLSPWLATLFDASILVLLLSPVLYLFVFRPMAQHISERERAQQALRESEMHLRTVFQTSPDAITISRLEDGKIIRVNEGFADLFGYTAEEVNGKSTLDINIWNDPKARENLTARLRKHSQLANFEAQLNQKDGKVITGSISANVIMLEEKPHMIAVTRDVSELKKKEQKVLASHRFLQIANRHKQMTPLLNEFIAETKKMTDCSAIGIRILDDDGNIPYSAYVGFSRRFYESESPLSIKVEKCMCMKVIRQTTDQKLPHFTETGSFYTNSTTHLMATIPEKSKKELRNVCNRFGYESVALVPIRTGETIHGLIHIADPRTDMISAEIVEILEGAAMQLGTSIERVRAEDALQKSHGELEKRVEDRTAKLLRANELLNCEIEERISNEKKLREQQEKLRSLSSELVLTEERQRRKIATELHDRIGQNLAITKIKLGELRESYPSNLVAGQLSKIHEIVNQTIQDTRSLTFEISPPVLYELGLKPALESLIDQIQEQHKIRIKFSDDGQPESLDDGNRVIFYRAVRELLFNIVKHACAQNVAVSIRRMDDSIQIGIEDDGVGFDISQFYPRMNQAKGFGLFSIRERFSHLGGRVEIQSKPGEGTRVILLLPVTSDGQAGERKMM
jgi:PAS domain S-box-containing protein